MSTVVKTQVELDAALAAGKADIIIDSPRGVWLTVSGSATVEASGSATVRASDSATVEAWDSATVRAWGSATVRASDSATVGAWDSATVEAWGSATVRAWDSATVEAWGSATVEASDSATVEAWGSATVGASDSATVRAWGSATVEAWGSATVRAGRYVAVHLHSQSVMLSGGVVIDMTALDRSDPATWCDLNGIDVTDGRALVYKAVDADLNAGHGYAVTAYPVGGTVTAPDWSSKSTWCGRGLHFGRSPMAAAGYHRGDSGPRYLACEVDLTEVVVLDDKIKARSCRVLREVDRHGREITA